MLGKVNFCDAIGGALTTLRRALAGTGTAESPVEPTGPAIDPTLPLPDRMARGLALYRGAVLLIMSGDDLTAREFDDVANASPSWSGQLDAARVTRHDLRDADHTFARKVWAEAVAEATGSWMGKKLSKHC